MSQKQKSDIWEYFIRIEKGGKCKLCLSEVKTSGNTTNLRNHIRRKHPTIQNLWDNVENIQLGPSGIMSKKRKV